jgi:hypothetical protein
MRVLNRLLGLALFASLQACGPQEEARVDEVIGSSTQDIQLSIKNADPSVIRVDST